MFQTTIKWQNILSWKSPARTTESNFWLYTGMQRIQVMCLRALSKQFLNFPVSNRIMTSITWTGYLCLEMHVGWSNHDCRLMCWNFPNVTTLSETWFLCTHIITAKFSMCWVYTESQAMWTIQQNFRSLHPRHFCLPSSLAQTPALRLKLHGRLTTRDSRGIWGSVWVHTVPCAACLQIEHSSIGAV